MPPVKSGGIKAPSPIALLVGLFEAQLSPKRTQPKFGLALPSDGDDGVHLHIIVTRSQ